MQAAGWSSKKYRKSEKMTVRAEVIQPGGLFSHKVLSGIFYHLDPYRKAEYFIRNFYRLKMFRRNLLYGMDQPISRL